MKTMQALRFERFGPPSVLSLEELPMPELRSGEVLVEVRASAINPSDVKNVAGQFQQTTLPRTPGRDYAGVVVDGDARRGEEVWGSGAGFGVIRDGAQAEYVVVPADSLSRKPSNLTMEQAAAIGVPYLAAWSALIDAADLQSGETLLVIGVSGAVGRAATQIAHWKNARVIGADISAGNPSKADAIINTTSQDLRKEVFALTDNNGADVVLDAVGGAMFEPALRSLRVGGRQIAVTSTGERRVSFDLIDFYHNQSHLIGVDTMKLSDTQIAELLDQLRAGFEEGLLQPPAITTWPLGRAVEAYQAVEKGVSPTKHVLRPRS
jgi:NADPH:quinone reductase